MESNTDGGVLHIKRFPGDLHREMRSRAVLRGETMGEWLARAIRNQFVLESQSELREVPAEENGLVTDGSQEQAQE